MILMLIRNLQTLFVNVQMPLKSQPWLETLCPAMIFMKVSLFLQFKCSTENVFF